jgi:hypothetical protein
MWKMLHAPGLECFELLHRGARWILRGTILHLHEDEPFEVRYSIECDSGWHTLSSRIELRSGSGERALQIEADHGRWISNGEPQPQLDGCIDIDLGWSPCTNTLPIRRLNLQNGADSGPVVAAWIKFPELALEPLPQGYHRVADHVYRYTSRGGTFTANLRVDEDGLVEAYEGFWQRVTSTDQ